MQHVDATVDAVSSNVSSRLYFLKQLKRSGAGPEDLLFFYVAAIPYHTSSARIRMPSVALEPHCCTAELSVGWVDPRVGLGWVGNGSKICVFSGLGWVMGLK